MEGFFKLPNELLCDRILWTLSLSDKAVTSAVCRKFNNILIPIVYGDIRIVISRDSWDLSQVQSLANTVRRQGATVKHIKRLKVCTDFEIPEDDAGLSAAVCADKRPYPENDKLFQHIEAFFHLPDIQVLNVVLPDPDDYGGLQLYPGLPLATQLQSLTLRYCEARDKVLEYVLSATPNLKKLRYEIWRFSYPEDPDPSPWHPEPEFSMEHFGRAIAQVKGSLEWLDISMLIYTDDFCHSWEYSSDWLIEGHIPALKDFTRLTYLEAPIILLFGHKYHNYPEATLRPLLPLSLTHLCLRDDVCTIFLDGEDWLKRAESAFNSMRRNLGYRHRPDHPNHGRHARRPQAPEPFPPLMMRLRDLQHRQDFAPNLSKVTIKANGTEDNQCRFDKDVLYGIAQFLADEEIVFELLTRPVEADDPEAYRETDYHSLRRGYVELA